MHENRTALLWLIAGRFILVSVILVATRWALPGAALSEQLFPYFLATSALTGIFLLLWKYSENGPRLYDLQFYTDLVLLTSLILFSGGVDSLFTPLYVLVIVYSSLFKGRAGGILGLAFCIVSYALNAHLAYFSLLPGSDGAQDLERILYRFSVNILAFVAVAFLGIYLSERLQTARKELGSARVVQQNIVDSMRSGLLTVDEQGQINFTNRVGEEILGYGSNELLGRHFNEIFPTRVFSRLREHDYQEHSRAFRIEEWVKTQSGTDLFLGMGCSPLLGQRRQRIGFVISFQDLTEIKEKEEEFQFREKMAAIGEMAAGLAHELRNPLGSLSGSIQILRSELTLSEDQSRLLEIVLRESERLNRIVEDFLAYASPQNPTRESFDLRPLLEETLELLRNTPEFSSQEYAITWDRPDGSVHCRGNSDQIKQVVWNVLQNAVRSMPDGGALSIELSKRDRMLLLRVQDAGVGMSRSVQEKLFQPFQSRFSKGSGLGMAIVYRIVRQHGGRIEVESSPGQGTRIDIFLPGT